MRGYSETRKIKNIFSVLRFKFKTFKPRYLLTTTAEPKISRKQTQKRQIINNRILYSKAEAENTNVHKFY